MKKLFFIILLSGIYLPGRTQLRTDFFLNATPPGTLTEWPAHKETLTLIVTGTPGLPPQSFKIKAEFKTTDGAVIGYTDLARAAVYISSQSAGTILNAGDVVPMENMVFSGKYKSSLQKTGKLPSDNYILCVQLVRPVDYTPLTAVNCKNFYLSATQLPILMKPYNEEALDVTAAQTAITFRWSPVVPHSPEPVTYRIQVFEVLNYQSPVQALRSNQPLLDQSVVGSTQYIWRPQLIFAPLDTATIAPPEPVRDPQKGYLFIWTIQSLNSHGEPVTETDGNGEGRSEPAVFYVRTKINKN